MSSHISRRQFLKGAVLGAAGISVSHALGMGAAAESEHNEPHWDYEADVVVIGAGGAGLPAALKAMEDGASVLIVEANYDVGGHCAMSGGNLHSGCGTEIQKKFGIDDSADLYYLDHTDDITLATVMNDYEHVRSVANAMAECYEFCIDKGMLLKDIEPGRPHWVGEGGTEPESVGRWTYADATTEGWVDDFSGKNNPGLGITRPLERTLRQQGAKFLLNYHMDKIHREDGKSGRVTGITASYTPRILPDETEPLPSLFDEGNIVTTKETVSIKANRGVIIATGGSTGNEYFRTMFDPRLGPEFDGLAGMPFSDQDGSGEIAAMEIGAALGNISQYMMHGGNQLNMAKRFGCRYGYGVGFGEGSRLWKLVRANGISPDYNSLCIVNMLGQRFANEDDGTTGLYSPEYKAYDFYNAAMSSVIIDPKGDGNARRYGGPIWAIFDHDAAVRNDWSMTQGIVDYEGGYCFKADTLEELAAAVVNKYYEDIKMDPQTLVDTISRYNSYVESGVDAEYGKKTLGHKIEKGPFYAAWATPNLHDCYAGLRVDPSMQVLDLHGELIPGLFCAGESCGGMRIHGLGRVMTSGYIAGRSAASTDEKGYSTASNALNPAYSGSDISNELTAQKQPFAAVQPTSAAAAESAAEPAAAAMDGELFTGVSENGINGTIQVQIAVKDKTITGIQVLKHEETEGIGAPAFPELIAQALATQSAKLDVISGATITCNAFMEALTMAMTKAGLL